MDSDNIQEKPSSVENVSYGDLEAESNNIDSLEAESSGGGTVRELESVARILTRVELDIVCSSEKLINMDTLVMHVASRETDFEAFSLEEDHRLEGPVVKALEFDLLYGFLDSEVRELESFLSALHTEIASSRETVSSFTHLGETFSDIKDKLLDCEDSLKKNFEQVSDIKKQSANFQRILSTFSGDDKCMLMNFIFLYLISLQHENLVTFDSEAMSLSQISSSLVMRPLHPEPLFLIATCWSCRS